MRLSTLPPFSRPVFSECLRFFFFNDRPPTEIYTLSLHDALPIYAWAGSPVPEHCRSEAAISKNKKYYAGSRSEEHTSELQSLRHLVCRLLLEKNNSEEPPAHPAPATPAPGRRCVALPTG